MMRQLYSSGMRIPSPHDVPDFLKSESLAEKYRSRHMFYYFPAMCPGRKKQKPWADSFPVLPSDPKQLHMPELLFLSFLQYPAVHESITHLYFFQESAVPLPYGCHNNDCIDKPLQNTFFFRLPDVDRPLRNVCTLFHELHYCIQEEVSPARRS